MMNSSISIMKIEMTIAGIITGRIPDVKKRP